MFKWVADVLVQEAGITPLLHRLCVAPIMENGAIRGVITESKAGREAILAKRVIDATGDADIASRAGAPFHKYPKKEMMSASVMFSMSGVNKRRFIEAVKADPQTYADWSGNGRMGLRDHGQGRQAVLSVSAQAVSRRRSRPASFHRTCTPSPARGASVSDQGDLTYLNLVHLPEIDGTDPE